MTTHLALIGAASSAGQKLKGVECGPAALRAAGLLKALKTPAHLIEDKGDFVYDEDLSPSSADASTVASHEEEGAMAEWEASKKEETLIEWETNLSYELGQYLQILCEAVKVSAVPAKVLTLGGDHGIAYGTVAGMLHHYPDLRIIWVDAHGDCNIPTESPSGSFHGMPLAFLAKWFDASRLRGWEWTNDVPRLAENRIAWIGLRDLDLYEKQKISEFKMCAYSTTDVKTKGVKEILTEIFHTLQITQDTPVHLSFDVDACDPTFAPGTGTPVPEGITDKEGFEICSILNKSANIVSMDLVEVNPELELDKVSNLTVSLGIDVIVASGF